MFRQPISWREMDRLRRDMDRLFESSFSRRVRQRTSGYPAINVWAKSEEGVIVTAELPGVEPGEVDVSVTGDTLTLEGTRYAEGTPESAQFHRQERSQGEFKRTVQLPFTVNNDQVEASLSNGVLRVVLPRAEAEKPRQIQIQAGQ